MKAIVTLGLMLASLNAATQPDLQLSPRRDSLVLSKSFSERKLIIYTGQKIELILANRKVLKGRFQHRVGDTLILKNIEHGLTYTELTNIQKIKIHSNLAGRITGGTLMAVGGTGFGIAAIGLVADFLLLSQGVTAWAGVGTVLALGASIPAAVLFFGGQFLARRKVDLTSKWHVAF